MYTTYLTRKHTNTVIAVKHIKANVYSGKGDWEWKTGRKGNL